MSLTVKSAGLDTTPGKPAHSNTKSLAQQQMLSVDEHVTTQLHADLVNQSDLIVVMEQGEIKERGTHRELLIRGGLYALLCEKQALEEELVTT